HIGMGQSVSALDPFYFHADAIPDARPEAASRGGSTTEKPSALRRPSSPKSSQNTSHHGRKKPPTLLHRRKTTGKPRRKSYISVKSIRAYTHKIAIGDSDLINVRPNSKH